MGFLCSFFLNPFNAFAENKENVKVSVNKPSTEIPKENDLDPFKSALFSYFKETHSDSLILSQNGKIIFESYGNGYDSEKKHGSWSIAKSITATFYGIMLSKGLVKESDTVDQYFPDVKNSEWSKVTLHHLVTMTSGIEWQENYDYSPFNSHVTAMLYRLPFLRNKGEYRLQQQKRVAEVGTRFNYSSGDTNLLALCLKKKIPNGDWISFAKENLFQPLKIEHFTLELDEEKNFMGSSYAYLRPLDYLKIADLYLNKGVSSDGKRILEESFIEKVQKPSSAFSTLRLNHEPQNKAYGMSFWLNQPVGSAQMGRVHASLPDDAYYGKGYRGQIMLIVPSLKLTMVRFGHDDVRERLEDHPFSLHEFGKILNATLLGGKK